jgi:cytoskeletal protein RodZ
MCCREELLVRLNFAKRKNKLETRVNVCSQGSFEKKKVAPSKRRFLQFLAALYIHTLMLGILVVFSRNLFSTAIRTVLLALLR